MTERRMTEGRKGPKVEYYLRQNDEMQKMTEGRKFPKVDCENL